MCTCVCVYVACACDTQLKTTGQWIIYYATWPATVATRPTIVCRHGTPTIVYPGMYVMRHILRAGTSFDASCLAVWLVEQSNYVYAAL